jgi:hypothetical protein
MRIGGKSWRVSVMVRGNVQQSKYLFRIKTSRVATLYTPVQTTWLMQISLAEFGAKRRIV